MGKRKISLWTLVLCAFLLTVAGAGDKGFNPPRASHAKTYPAHESHDDEKVSIAVEPYDSPDKAAIFKVKYHDSGFITLRLIISNDGDVPLMLDQMKIQYITGRRAKLDPATKDDLYRRISQPSKAGSKPTVRLPIPGPRKQPTAISREALEEIDSALFTNVPVTPHSSNSGFLFFDVIDIENPEATGAHVYISGIRIGSKETFYFDIPLEKAVTNPPSAVIPK
ncbi:MAG TPA: hypothetical protein VKL40_07375 [Candidatus Angelobacter sp.]|nr:hypothetical protein [Candidatus Angelobacter sp.]